MTTLERWFMIFALWVIAISCFIFSVGNRYTPVGTGAFYLDKWTGECGVRPALSTQEKKEQEIIKKYTDKKVVPDLFKE